jgi:NitT/TauT family transport system substrate-binding protein
VRTLLKALVPVVAVLLAGTAAAQDQVNVRFSWKLKGEYGPLYLALEQDLYKRAGLNVRLGEGAGAQAALGSLIQGQEDIVILPGIFALTAIDKGMPIKLVAIYHPKTPMVLISMPDNPVRVPKDLEGKTVAHSVGDTATSYLDVLCKINGVDCGKVRKVQMNIQARYPQFLARQVDVVSTYTNVDLPILERQSSTKYTILDLSAYGLAVPGLAAVTSDDHIAKKGPILRRFLKATADGVREAKRDVDVATKALMKHWSGGPSAEIVGIQIKSTTDVIPEIPGKPIGWIDEKLIADTLAILKSAGEIKEPKAPATYYTNSLLEN